MDVLGAPDPLTTLRQLARSEPCPLRGLFIGAEDDEGMLLARRVGPNGDVQQLLADLRWTGNGEGHVRAQWEPVVPGRAVLSFTMYDPARIGADHGLVVGDWTNSPLEGSTWSGDIGGVWSPGEARAAVVAYWTRCN